VNFFYDEIARLNGQLAQRDRVIGDLMEKSADLRAQVTRLQNDNAHLRAQLDDPPQRGRISHRGSNGRWYDTEEEARSQYTWSEGGRENP
jgi:regulator of replication initiation timing